MHLLFDGQSLQSPSSRNRGIGRFARNLLVGVREVRPDWRISFVQNTHTKPADRDALPDGLDFLWYHTPLLHDGADRAIRWVNDRCYADWLMAQGADALLTVSVFEGDCVQPLFSRRRMPHFVVIHDLIPVLFSERCLGESEWTLAYTDRLHQMCSADVLLANSRCSARDYRRLMPKAEAEVVTIGGTTDPAFTPLTEAELAALEPRVRERFNLNGEFVLNGGGDCWRKNMTGSLEAYAELPAHYRANLDFVVACKIGEHDETRLRDLADRLGVGDKLRLTGFISDEELRALYSLCRVFMFPSLYEGLGLPIVEGLRCGAPVVTSDCSSMPEYAGEVSFLANPLRNESVRDALQQALDEPREERLAARLAIGNQFCWNHSAELTCESIEGLIRERRFQKRPHRPRLAWVCPTPPSEEEFALHGQAMAEALRDEYIVEFVIADDQPWPESSLMCQFPVIRASELASRQLNCPYDLFVYHLGDEPAASHMPALMEKHPGVVVLHDLRLGHLIHAAVSQGEYPVDLDEEFEIEGERDVARWLREGKISPERACQLYPQHRRLLGTALSIVVHSEQARHQLRDVVSCPISVVEPGIRPPLRIVQVCRSLFGLPSDRPHVIGVLPIQQHLESLLDAISGLPGELSRRCTVAVLGTPNRDACHHWNRAATQRGLPGSVFFLGSVSSSNLPSYLAALDLFVHLEDRYDRALSPTLLQAMAQGIACVVHDQGPVANLPDTAVCKVPVDSCRLPMMSATLEVMLTDLDRRRNVIEAGQAHVQSRHTFRRVGKELSDVFRKTITESTKHSRRTLAFAA